MAPETEKKELKPPHTHAPSAGETIGGLTANVAQGASQTHRLDVAPPHQVKGVACVQTVEGRGTGPVSAPALMQGGSAGSVASPGTRRIGVTRRGLVGRRNPPGRHHREAWAREGTGKGPWSAHGGATG